MLWRALRIRVPGFLAFSSRLGTCEMLWWFPTEGIPGPSCSTRPSLPSDKKKALP